MNKRIKSGLVWVIAMMMLLSMAPAMAATSATEPQPDGILVNDVMQNQFTVVKVGIVENDDDVQFMDGADGVVRKTREAVLEDKDGVKKLVKLGKEVRNFDQIKVGDKVTITIAAQMAFFVGKSGMVPGMGESKVTISAPKGAKPGLIEIEKKYVTLTIIKLDPAKKQVTVKLMDGTVKVSNTPNLDFSKVKVGEDVIVMFQSEQSILVTAP